VTLPHHLLFDPICRFFKKKRKGRGEREKTCALKIGFDVFSCSGQPKNEMSDILATTKQIKEEREKREGEKREKREEREERERRGERERERERVKKKKTKQYFLMMCT